MKNFLIIILTLSSNPCNAITDSLNIINNIKDTTYLSINNGLEMFQTKDEFWNSAGFVALITVLISGIIGFFTSKYITQKSIEIQIKMGEKQIKLAKSQLLKQSKMTIESIRANNISNARINWIEELRPLMGKLISDTAIFEFELKRRMEHSPNSQLEVTEPIYKKFEALNLAFNEVKLFLNHDEPEHLEFIRLVDKYIERSIERANGINDQPNEIVEDVLVASARKILKKTWEQAKDEVKVNKSI